MAKSTNCFVPSRCSFKWIITDGEENAVPSIILTIGENDPIRSLF